MKRVVIEKPVETVIDLNDVTEDQIIIGYYKDGGYWHKLSRFHEGDSRFEWCALRNSHSWLNYYNTLKEAIKGYMEFFHCEVYVFDTFEEFIEEFPALVESKK